MIPCSAKDPFSTISLSSSAQPVFPSSTYSLDSIFQPSRTVLLIRRQGLPFGMPAPPHFTALEKTPPFKALWVQSGGSLP